MVSWGFVGIAAKEGVMSYSLDGQKVSFTQLIDAAKDEGYSSSDGFFRTSEAAQVLRDNGHEVSDWKEKPEPCRCECGYRCGGPGKCKLPIMECLEQDDGKHFVRDCDHVWDGEPIEEDMPGGGSFGSVTCSKCGMDAMSHDMRHGP